MLRDNDSLGRLLSELLSGLLSGLCGVVLARSEKTHEPSSIDVRPSCHGPG